MVFAVDRIVRHVAQRVVHPAHVPFVSRSRGRRHRSGATPSARRSIPRRPVVAPRTSPNTSSFIRRRKSIASRFSRPPICVGDPFARLAGCNRDRASRPPHRPAARRCETRAANTARSTAENSPPRGGRNCRSACSSRGGSPGADRHARRARCRRNARGHAGRSGNGRAPNRASSPRPARVAGIDKGAEISGAP